MQLDLPLLAWWPGTFCGGIVQTGPCPGRSPALPLTPASGGCVLILGTEKALGDSWPQHPRGRSRAPSSPWISPGNCEDPSTVRRRLSCCGT